MSSQSTRQAAHYDRVLSEYDSHYYDPQSLAYRTRYILEPLLAGMDLNGKKVADLASGSGQTSLYLKRRFPDIDVRGFDISSEACRRYREVVGCPAFEVDLTTGYEGGETFDVAIVMGGLHHCVSDLPRALATIAGMLRPGGLLLMFEPNSDYVLEFARKLWYRLDKYFDQQTEGALSHAAIARQAQGLFAPISLHYFGGPAFYLIYNSLIFRMPRGLKRGVSPILFGLETAFNRLPNRWLHASFLARWAKV